LGSVVGIGLVTLFFWVQHGYSDSRTTVSFFEWLGIASASGYLLLKTWIVSLLLVAFTCLDRFWPGRAKPMELA
jgi:hypothetical protein